MIILIKNEYGIGYKITPGRVEVEKSIELGLDGIERGGWLEWVGSKKNLVVKNFYFLNFLKNFYKNS